MKQKLKWLAIVLAVSLLGFGTALFLMRTHARITPESWRQIEIGMTENQVEEILGVPGMGLDQLHHFLTSVVLSEPIGYCTRLENWQIRLGLDQQDTHRFWTSQRHCLQIGFDGTGKLRGKVLWESGKPSSIIDRLRDWLGW